MTQRSAVDKRVHVVETLPDYDLASVGRVASRVQIRNVELVASQFDRNDDGPLPGAIEEIAPDITIGLEWAFDESDSVLGCLLTFSAETTDKDSYALYAKFRLTYEVPDGVAGLDESDIVQFVSWNAVFNGWPYWREYLTSTFNRAQLPRFMVPVLPLPVPSMDQAAVT